MSTMSSTSLRQECIEAMAEALPNRCAFIEDAEPALDALLAVLTEHVREWEYQAWSPAGNEFADVIELIAVLEADHD